MKWRPVVLLLLPSLLMAAEAKAQRSDSWAWKEYLMWWVKDGPAPPPMATQAPASSPALLPGVLGQPDTTVLLGGAKTDQRIQSGGRFTFGRWLNAAPCIGVEGSYLFLGKQNRSSSVANDGSSFLTNPFYDMAPGMTGPSANYLTAPGPGNSGTATLTTSHQLQGAELNGVVLLKEDCVQTWSLLAGYRFLYVNEGLSFATTQNDDVSYFPGQFVNTFDQFSTRNYFHGGQIGVRGEWNRGRWFFGSTLKMAFGATHEVLRIQGASTTNTGPNYLTQIPVTTGPGGIYAQPTNIGRYDRDRFAVLPEVTLRVGLQVVAHLRVFVGYNFLYLSQLARPGNQIDGAVNSTQLISFNGLPSGPLIGAARPAAHLNSSSYWAQGFNIGGQFAW